MTDRMAAAVLTADTTGSLSDGTTPGADGVAVLSGSPATKPAKVVFSPFEQAGSSAEAHASR